MSTGTLKVNLSAICENWAHLDALSAESVETSAVVKANAYGLGLEPVATALANKGVRSFFVATSGEGASLRKIIGDAAEIYVFGAQIERDTSLLKEANLVALLNSPQDAKKFAASPLTRFGLQLDTGMNRLGFEAYELPQLAFSLIGRRPELVMSHLACADSDGHPTNAMQLSNFMASTFMFAGIKRSLAATGGILLGKAYHFEMTRPGIGLYGGLPFKDAKPVVTLELPVLQIRDVALGEAVGYGDAWRAKHPSRVATLSGGYADGILRSLSGKLKLYHKGKAFSQIGRISMDTLGIDVTGVSDIPPSFELLGQFQKIDDVAALADTIGYEILTSLGQRFDRIYS